MPAQLTVAQIFDAFLAGNLTRPEVEKALSAAWDAAGYNEEEMSTSLEQWYDLLRRTNINAAGFALPSKTTTGPLVTTTPSTTSPIGPVTRLEGQYLSEDPTAAWNRAYNLPSVGANPFQAWLRSQSGPAYSAYAGKNIADQMAGLPGTSFGSYLGPQDLGAAPQRALTTLRGLLGAGEPTQQDWMKRLGGEDVGGDLGQMFEAAIQGRGYASPFARAASRNVPGYQREWSTQTLGGSRQQGTGTLLAYLMKRMGLS